MNNKNKTYQLSSGNLGPSAELRQRPTCPQCGERGKKRIPLEEPAVVNCRFLRRAWIHDLPPTLRAAAGKGVAGPSSSIDCYQLTSIMHSNNQLEITGAK